MALPSTAEFRPVQYLGSKWRVLDQLSDAIDAVTNVDRPEVADIFAGSGVVARRIARKYSVHASDIQEYSRVITSALLRPARLHVGQIMRSIEVQRGLDRPSWLDALIVWERAIWSSDHWAMQLADNIENGSIAVLENSGKTFVPTALVEAAHEVDPDSKWTLLRHYGGVYFSYEQAADLDVVAQVVRAIDEPFRDTALAALMSTASDLVDSVGSHFAQPLRPRDSNGDLKMIQLRDAASGRQRDVRTLFGQKLQMFVGLRRPLHHAEVIRAPFDEALQRLGRNVGTVYADPPYTREHYSRFYHVLETIALGDDPGISTVRQGGTEVPSRGLYRLQRHQSPFSIVSQAPAAFDFMFTQLAERHISLVLSYSPVPDNEKPRARVIGVEALLKLAQARFPKVQVLQATGIRHSKFNNGSLNAPAVDQAEVFITCSYS